MRKLTSVCTQLRYMVLPRLYMLSLIREGLEFPAIEQLRESRTTDLIETSWHVNVERGKAG
jgi:hypothetical protein